MKTKKEINFDPIATSNFPSENKFVIQGKDIKWRDSKHGAASPYDAIKLAKDLDICVTGETELRVVKSK